MSDNKIGIFKFNNKIKIEIFNFAIQILRI